jgi:hypothetical protein
MVDFSGILKFVILETWKPGNFEIFLDRDDRTAKSRKPISKPENWQLPFGEVG